jgi:hypothetical protein
MNFKEKCNEFQVNKFVPSLFVKSTQVSMWIFTFYLRSGFCDFQKTKSYRFSGRIIGLFIGEKRIFTKKKKKSVALPSNNFVQGITVFPFNLETSPFHQISNILVLPTPNVFSAI